MACSNYKLKVFLNSIQIHSDTGCAGEVHTFTTSTTLPGQVTYKWSLDGISPPKPLLGSNSTYTYTFDNLDHTLYLVATGSECSIETTILLKAKLCAPQCPVECQLESTTINAGKLKYLVDSHGNSHTIGGNNFFECSPTPISVDAPIKVLNIPNDKAVKAIKDFLKGQPNCSQAPIGVSWRFNSTSKCITITISNSPIKFKSIIIGGNSYTFNTNNC